MNRVLHYVRAERGQAILEVAILAPFLLVLLVSIVDIGRLYHYNTIVGNSARAGVQYGIQSLATAQEAGGVGMVNAAKADANQLAGLSATAGYACKCSDGSAAPSCAAPPDCTSSHLIITVNVVSTMTFHPLFKYPWIPSPISLSHTATMQFPQ